ncbi:MAG: cbb3-type cytochrome c oxidase subunit 3 [Pseudomonadota bacterium]
MDINDLRGISTVFMLVAFLGLVFWAYSGKRKKSFDEAANLPFADENKNTRGDSSL